MRRLAGVFAAVALLATGCGGSAEEGASVNGDQYAPEVKERIDSAVDAADCDALQQEFDTADGHGDADLMTYIDDAMESAGCY